MTEKKKETAEQTAARLQKERMAQNPFYAEREKAAKKK